MKILRQTAAGMVLVLAIAGIAFAGVGRDYCEVHKEAGPTLCSYEPTTIGYTKDSDDSHFMDFKVSVRYQLFPDWVTRSLNWMPRAIPFFPSGVGDDSALYLAFTGRFGQYIGTRDSSPVVEKLFNPKVFYRYWTDDGHKNHIDVAFAHQSNGQAIDSSQEYQDALATSQNEHAVKDQLSRGWDYWEASWKRTWYERERPPTVTPAEPCTGDVEKCKKAADEAACIQKCRDCDTCRGIDGKKTSIVSYLGFKHFLQRGPLQGYQENYNEWETDPEGKDLDQVSGLSAMLKWTERGERKCFSDLKIAVRYETGTDKPFRYDTVRVEVGTKIIQLPVSVWRQAGYNSDLAQYFKKVRSVGIQAEIGSF